MTTPASASPAEVYKGPRAYKCPHCDGVDFRLEVTEAAGERRHLYLIRCANCRMNVGTGFPC